MEKPPQPPHPLMDYGPPPKRLPPAPRACIAAALIAAAILCTLFIWADGHTAFSFSGDRVESYYGTFPYFTISRIDPYLWNSRTGAVTYRRTEYVVNWWHLWLSAGISITLLVTVACVCRRLLRR